MESLMPVNDPVSGFHMTLPMKYCIGTQIRLPMMYQTAT